jgi:hypothetical protein
MTAIRAIDRSLGRAEPGKAVAIGKTRLQHRLDRLGAMTDDETAATAVEFALAVPLLLVLLMPLAELGLAFSQQIQVQQAAQAGAEYASRHPWNSSSVTAIENAISSASRLTLLPWSDPILSQPNPWPQQICGCPNPDLNLKKIDPATCASPCANGESAGYYVIVNAQVSYSRILPFSLLENPTPLVAQATVRSQ